LLWRRVLQYSFFLFFLYSIKILFYWLKIFSYLWSEYLFSLTDSNKYNSYKVCEQQIINISLWSQKKKCLLSNVQQFGYHDNLSLEESSPKNGKFSFYQKKKKKASIKWAEPRDVLKIPWSIFVHQPLLYLLTPCLLLH
jgi:hypothetical protein